MLKMHMEVKGTAVITIRDFVKNNYSKEYQKWINSLPVDSKKIYSDAIDSTKWYPVVSAAKDPTESISDMFFGGDYIKGANASGLYSASKALTGVYKIFVKAANPQYIIKRATRVFSKYYRPIEFHVVDEKDKSVIVELTKINVRFEIIENRIMGWCYKALEISGCKNVIITNKFSRKDENGIVVEINMRWD